MTSTLDVLDGTPAAAPEPIATAASAPLPPPADIPAPVAAATVPMAVVTVSGASVVALPAVPAAPLLQQLVDAVTRRGFLTTEFWAPLIGIALTWLVAKIGLGGGSWPTYIAEAAPVLSGMVVAVLITIRKAAIARNLIAPTVGG